MFKLPILPSQQARPNELADFAELMCLHEQTCSKQNLKSYLGRIADNCDASGYHDTDEQIDSIADEIMNEIGDREAACHHGYPFTLDPSGTVIGFNEAVMQQTKPLIYLYLLLCTRLNMQRHRLHSELDGTELFEELSAHVIKNYIGPERSQSLIFGTASGGSFKDKVNDLCKRLKEAHGFENLDGATVPTHAKDGKLDVVAWVPFSDARPGQLIIFGQSKTGTNWQDSLSQTQPENFIKKWIKGHFLITPMRAFFIAEAPDRLHWNSTCAEAGILFDRFRLVDFSDNLPIGQESQIREWTRAAIDTIRFY